MASLWSGSWIASQLPLNQIEAHRLECAKFTLRHQRTMKKSKFSEEQIAYALRQADGGTPVGDVCRQLGVSEATFYVWKKKYGKLGLSELREIRQLRDENPRLKRLVADLTLDKHILSEMIRKKSEAGTAATARGVDPGEIPSEHRALGSAGAIYTGGVVPQEYGARPSALAMRIRDLAHAWPRFGYQRITVLLRREGWRVNRKRVRRLYRLQGLQLRMRVRRRKHMCLHRGPAPLADLHARTMEHGLRP